MADTATTTGHTFGSLFAGVGGFDLGMETAGWECGWQVEWDKHCQQVLARHWPNTPRYSDVRDVFACRCRPVQLDAHWGHPLQPANSAGPRSSRCSCGGLPPVDCITFGSPCQDLSVAGNRAGLDGERSGLFYEAIRIIKEMRHATDGTFPRWAIWENVAGALSSNKGDDFAAVLNTLADTGALVIEWAILDARWFGVPQRRRRVFVIACFDPAIAAQCPDPLLPVAPRSSWNPPSSGATGTDFTSALTGGLGSGGPDAAHAAAGWLVPATATALTSKCGNTQDDQQTGQLIPEAVPYVKVIRSGARDDDGNLPPEVGREEHTAPTLNSIDNTSEARATVLAFDSTWSNQSTVSVDLSPTVKVGSGLGISSPPAVLAIAQNQRGELVESDYAHALTSSGGGKPSEGYPAARVGAAVRRLTPLECERLMGWPDDHTRWRADGTEQSESARYKQCGNGVASPVAAWIGHHLANATPHNEEARRG